MKKDTRITSRLQHDPLVRGLGWASALLDVPQVVAPAGFARALGVGDTSRHRLGHDARSASGRCPSLSRTAALTSP
ncbi:hypothetical protein [Streptomyces sp. NPDC056690]|uniref:hypothetical protein n=1 Tax=unclassified Streptomyces TaxID=2593676 RepID=UPI00364403BF